MENATLLVGVWAAVATTLSVWFAFKAHRPKAKPVVDEKRLAWPAADERSLDGSITVFNKGSKPCSLKCIRLLAEGWKISMSGATELRLPLPIKAHHPATLSFRATVEPQTIPGVAEEEAIKEPETVTIELQFDCLKKPICEKFVRDEDSSVYQYK